MSQPCQQRGTLSSLQLCSLTDCARSKYYECNFVTSASWKWPVIQSTIPVKVETPLSYSYFFPFCIPAHLFFWTTHSVHLKYSPWKGDHHFRALSDLFHFRRKTATTAKQRHFSHTKCISIFSIFSIGCPYLQPCMNSIMKPNTALTYWISQGAVYAAVQV